MKLIRFYKMQCFENIKRLYETSDQKTDEIFFQMYDRIHHSKTPYADTTAEEIDEAISVETIPDRKKRRTQEYKKFLKSFNFPPRSARHRLE